MIPFDYKPVADVLKDRVILVTGAGDGLGRAAAKAFAQYGATVILLGRTTQKLEAVYDEIETAGYPQAAIYPMNLEGAVAKDYEDFATRITEEFGCLHGILHNAAELGELTPLQQYDVSTWFKVMQVNLNAPFMLTRACLGLLHSADEASVVFTSSKVGRKGKAYWGAYSVSNFAVEGLSQVLADELENNTHIRVNSLDPGAVRTRLRAIAYPAEDPETVIEPATIMNQYVYLMATDSHGVHGQMLNCQGDN